MKNIFRFAKRSTEPIKVSKSIKGVTESEWLDVYNAIKCEHTAAKLRQRSADAKPSDFMRGLAYALNILDGHRPHIIEEVQ